MRKTISGLLATLALTALGSASAAACGGLLQACGGHPATGYGHYGYAGVARYERLPANDLPLTSGQYYHVDQGPVYSGPGNFAPYPTYQETAIRGWSGYERGYDYPYDGGPYGNATNHFSDAAPTWRGPQITSYRWRAGLRPWRHRSSGFGMRPTIRSGYSPSGVYHFGHAGPRVMNARRPGGTRQY